MSLGRQPGRFETAGSPCVPEPSPGLYSNCLRAGGTIYVSGQHAGQPGGGAIGGNDVYEQTKEALTRVLALVEAAGATAADIIKMTVYLTDVRYRGEVSRARKGFFSDPLPCSTLIGVNALVQPDLLVEIDAIAIVQGVPGIRPARGVG